MTLFLIISWLILFAFYKLKSNVPLEIYNPYTSESLFDSELENKAQRLQIQHEITKSESSSKSSSKICIISRQEKLLQINGMDGSSFQFVRDRRQVGVKALTIAVWLLLRQNYSVQSQTSREVLWSEPSGVVPKIIHFISYNERFLERKYLCALEAAALHNPEYQIVLHTADPLDFKEFASHWIDSIDFNSRLLLRKIDYKEMFMNTPLQDWYQSGTYGKSHWPLQNLGNALRLAILWKSGGCYLDLDIISLNPLPVNTRFVAREDGIRANNAAISSIPSDPFLWSAMEIFGNNYQGYSWGQNGFSCI